MLDDNALSRGFMVAANSLNVHGYNGNDNVSAEAMLMLKEHIAETYGDDPPRRSATAARAAASSST